MKINAIKIKLLLADLELTMENLADLSGVGRTTIYEMLSKPGRKVRLQTIGAIAKILKVKSEEIVVLE